MDLLSLHSAKDQQQHDEAKQEAEKELEEMRSRLEKLSKERDTTQGAFKELQSRFNALNDEIVAVEEEKAKQLRAMRETTREGGVLAFFLSFFIFFLSLAQLSAPGSARSLGREGERSAAAESPQARAGASRCGAQAEVVPFFPLSFLFPFFLCIDHSLSFSLSRLFFFLFLFLLLCIFAGDAASPM